MERLYLQHPASNNDIHREPQVYRWTGNYWEYWSKFDGWNKSVAGDESLHFSSYMTEVSWEDTWCEPIAEDYER